MEKIMLSGIYYTIEFVKVWLVSQGIFRIKYKKNLYYWFVISMIGMMMVSSWYYIVQANPIVYMVCMYVVFLLTLREKKNIGWVFFINIGISILDVLISCAIIFVAPSNADKMMHYPVVTILYNLISLTIFALVFCIIAKKRKQKASFWRYSDALICIVCAVSIMILIAPMQMGMLGFNDNWSMLSTVLSVTLLAVSIVLLYFKKQRELIQFEKDMVQKMMEAQELYYTTMLQKDEETKCFRHDIREYLFCIQMLHKEKKYEELDVYLSQMEGRVNDFSPRFSTGNEYVNMILNEMVTQFDNVKLELVGKIPKLCLENMDVCSLFYNLLKNSFEAVQNVEDKMVKMSIRLQDTNMIIELSNPYKHINYDKEGGVSNDQRGKKARVWNAQY